MRDTFPQPYYPLTALALARILILDLWLPGLKRQKSTCPTLALNSYEVRILLRNNPGILAIVFIVSSLFTGLRTFGTFKYAIAAALSNRFCQNDTEAFEYVMNTPPRVSLQPTNADQLYPVGTVPPQPLHASILAIQWGENPTRLTDPSSKWRLCIEHKGTKHGLTKQ